MVAKSTASWATACLALSTHSVSGRYTTTRPQPIPTCTNTICVDKVDACGQTYGGCYADCPGSKTPSFTAPSCSPTTSAAITTVTFIPPIATVTFIPPITTVTFIPPITTIPKKTCTSTICEDFFDDCGNTWGGCFPNCAGYPTPSFTFPECHTTPTTSAAITTVTKITKETCTSTICEDFFDDCGHTWGGCFPNCAGYPTPTFTSPECHTTSTSAATITTVTSIPKKPCTSTVCVDKIDPCGQTYGGCAPFCGGSALPTFTAPSCSLTSTLNTVTTTPKPTPSCAQTQCVDAVNACGETYGGCYPNCAGLPTPTFTPPPCSTSASSKHSKY